MSWSVRLRKVIIMLFEMVNFQKVTSPKKSTYETALGIFYLWVDFLDVDHFK